MKAWRLSELGGSFTFEDVPEPRAVAGSAVVRIEASALVSYMRAYVEGQLPFYHAPDGPFTPGGNAVGVVEDVGEGVWQLAVGQRVIVSSLVTSSEPSSAPAQMLLGITSFGGESEQMQALWRDGTLAEKAVLPASSLTPISDDLAHFDAATLSVASRFVVPFGGLERGRLTPGETLIVNGATGAYGGAAALLGVAMGAGRIVAAGRNADKLAAVVRLAGPSVVTVVLTGDVERDAAALRDAADGGADLAFDMVGGATDPSSTLAALHALRRRGRLVLMGSMTVDLPIPYLKLMIDSIEVIGNFMHGPDAYRRVLALVRAGTLNLGAIDRRCFQLANLEEAMRAAEAAGSFEAAVVTPLIRSGADER